MSIFFLLFKHKKIYIILLFSFTLISISKIKPKSEYKQIGEKHIQNKQIKKYYEIIPEAKIDEDGVYKYIQIICNNDYIFIRGRKDCKFHKYIYNKFLNEIKNNNLDINLCKCVGGGRIKNNKKEKKILIYGYSKYFGRAENQHEITKKILEKYYPEYEITWTNEGY